MFGIGYSKYASGTVASFVTCVIFYSLYSIGYLESRGIYLICVIIIIFFLSILLIDKFSSAFDEKDAKEIVIDEFVGQNIPLFFLLFIPLNTNTYNKDFIILIVLSFVFFRFFDILKPYPINLIDKKMKNTLQAVSKHKYCDVLEGFGDSDITYNLSFNLINSIVKELSSLTTMNTTQGKFLTKLGILERAEILSKKMLFSEKADIYFRIKRLIDKNQMVELFKVMLITTDKNKFKLGF